MHPLTSSEVKIFDSLESGELKTRIQAMLSKQDLFHFNIAKIALQIIQETKSKPSERLLHCVLLEPDSKTLSKILYIAQQGYFEDLLCKFNSTKAYHNHNKVKEIIDLFDPNQPSPSAIKKLQKCSYYYQLPKIVERNVPLSKKLHHLFQQLNTQYNERFNEKEKLKLVQTLCLINYSEIELSEFLAEACLSKDEAGEEVLGYFFISIKNEAQPVSINEMIRALKFINETCHSQTFYDFVEKWKKAAYQWKVFDWLETSIVSTGMDQVFVEEDIQSRIKRFAEDPTVSKPLALNDIELISFQYQTVNDFCKQNQHLSFNQLLNLAHKLRAKAKNTLLSDIEQLHLIAIGRLAIRLHFGLYPNSTQVLALLGVLLRDERRQAQVKTGEGKSIIVTLWAFVMAMECRGVDIITSARYLAMRDQERFSPFFDKCGVTTSHICHDRKKPSHFRAQILYGPAFDFEFAWMQDQLWNTKLFEERARMPFVARNFDVVCVDEADNLLIDTACNGARLSFPAKISYDWIYAPLLTYVKTHLDQASIPQMKDFICQYVNPEQQELCREISDKQMYIWVKSAYQALFEYEENVNYVIKNNNRKIQIVDLQTGRISENSRWSDGIHEFLEVKHDITVEKESLTPISLSHVVFYGLYRTVTALTGTAEHYQTKNIYHIHTFHVPPHLPLKRIDLPPIFANNTEEYYALIIENAKYFIKLKRPLLILTATILDSFELGKRMEEQKIPYQLLNEIQEEEERIVIARAGIPGKITIATNTAGRGTDIILEKKSLKNGGLHVLLTFYPETEREEEQAIGRAGRQGQKGSSQMILNKDSKLLRDISSNPTLDDLLSYRKRRSKELNYQHMARAALELAFALKTNLFYTAFQKWVRMVNQDTFLEFHSQRLSKIKLPRTKINHPLLSKKEQVCRDECFRLLFSKECENVSWKVFLSNMIEQVKDKVLVEWAELYFQPMEQKIKNATDCEACAQEIKDEFTKHRLLWEKYLDPKGLGIFIYLEELTSLNLIKDL